jgi:hypothetical protein
MQFLDTETDFICTMLFGFACSSQKRIKCYTRTPDWPLKTKFIPKKEWLETSNQTIIFMTGNKILCER